jgi:hypothetical protein
MLGERPVTPPHPAATPHPARLLAGLLAIGALLAGCGASSPSRPATGRESLASLRSRMLGFATCMRSHGVANFPDPQVNGSGNGVQVRISPGNANLDSPAFKTAGQVCRKLLPGGGPPHGAITSQQHAREVSFAVCMRKHGLSSFPDPGRDGAFDLPASIDPQAAAFQRAMTACRNQRPDSLLFGHEP